MEATAELPDGTTRWLIATDDWDFRWQDVYRYRADRAAEGMTVSMRIRTITGGQSAQPAPSTGACGPGTEHVGRDGRSLAAGDSRAAADEPTLTADFPAQGARQRSGGIFGLLRGDPANPLRHDASRALSRRRPARRGDRGVPRRCGSTASRRRRITRESRCRRAGREEAIAAFREALRLDPDYAQAHNNLGALLQVSGQTDAALEHYLRAASLRPDNVESHTNLGQLLANRGQTAEAVRQFS
jgi:hypothetical protein